MVMIMMMSGMLLKMKKKIMQMVLIFIPNQHIMMMMIWNLLLGETKNYILIKINAVDVGGVWYMMHDM